MKTLIYILTLTGLWAASSLPLAAQPSRQDSTAVQPVWLDSLRLTIDTGSLRWLSLRYEAEVRVSPIYFPGKEAEAPDSFIVFIDVTRGASFWKETGDDHYERSDHLVLHKDQFQAKGKVSWLSGDSIEVTASYSNITNSRKTGVSFPALLWLLALAGGAVGGWLSHSREIRVEGKSRAKTPPSKLKILKEAIQVILTGMVAGILLYLLNQYSPVYLGFRTYVDLGWFIPAEPLLTGFIGGWGGISLVVGLMDQFFKKGDQDKVDATGKTGDKK